MLKTEKKIRAELKRLEKMLYYKRRPLDGWTMKQGYYKKPEVYNMTLDQWTELPMGEHIGKKDMTVFLKNQVVLDREYRGKKTVLLLKVGGEGCLSINGQHYNGLDYNRNMILLAESAKGDETYNIEIETYCKDLILDSANIFKTDVVITQSEIAAIHQSAWDFYFEVKTGFEFTEGGAEEYTKQRVYKLIYDALLKLDYRNEETFEASVVSAKEYYLQEINKYSDLKLPVKMYFAGHSHIDVAWHWPLKETVRKVSRTFSSMLRLMEQYEDFKFCQSMPVLYEMAKEYYPELYAQVKERVKEGRWETLGSMYLEPDCNLISGESFVRQILYGKKFYQEELDSDSNICFLPDVFGYSSAMPQILKKAGTDYFFTTKLTWNETNEFPYSVFRWRGLDGTEILSGMMSMCTERGLGLYNGDLTPKGVRMSMDYFKNKENGDPILYLYGHGDGGGGVTKEMLESVTRLDKVPMMPKIEIGTVKQYFEELDKEKEYPVWSGELYFEKHRGTYTTAAKNKRNNRKSEFLYRNAEIMSVFQYLKNGQFVGADLEKGWKLILLNQFHDILPGTCIGEVYEMCDRQYEEIRQIGENSISQNIEKMVFGEGAVTVYNTLSWSRDQVVSVAGKGYKAVKDSDGVYPKQVRLEDGTIRFLAEQVPSLGYKVYYFTEEEPQSEPGERAVQKEKNIYVSNKWMDLVINEEGELESIFDKSARRQVLKAGETGNKLKLLEDIPVEWGAAWETTTKKNDKDPIPCTSTVCRVKEDNSIRTVIGISKEIHTSKIEQEMIIYHHTPMIEFKTMIDWDECQKMLRVEFPADINSLTARYDVAFGNAEHPNHATTSYDQARFEVCGHKWGDVSDASYGVSLLNDCKYGYTIQNSRMELSLLRSADFPSDTCDKGVHTFSYWIYPHVGNIQEAGVAQKGYEVNVPLIVTEGQAEAATGSYIQLDNSNAVIDTVKRSEDGRDIIVRLFETYNTVSDAVLKFNFPVTSCQETDLLERHVEDIPVEEGSIRVKLHPYEIKTYRICCK
ncbi:alpha-mannosidase [Lacrimispora sp. 210928-DFI.3.58]|uniref:alpha-mannosidase n=1 Tax=Lacrimispora sp. 210928-DFI.3.58 TaxID=2883214 RepID=UPI001D097E09|nr:glycoside hydrolase family 38 C-terminal domain-containing protein [Lacrimispora sp. 210928-DFI.3.58]MCB7321304.1 glycosyl hydrolase-related protein [Lacrimispora sp. 210928-DFI.3.58]